MSRATLLVLAALASGCAFSTETKRTPGAPNLPPSSYAEVTHKPPGEGATELARLEALGNNWQSASDCEARLILDARKVGANLVFVQPQETGVGQGPKCSGTAYLVAK